MSEDVFKKEQLLQDSYTYKLSPNCTLKVYLDMTDLKECELKLKNFEKIRRFVPALSKIHFPAKKKDEIKDIPQSRGTQGGSDSNETGAGAVVQ